MLTKQSKMQFQVSQISSLNRGLLNSYLSFLKMIHEIDVDQVIAFEKMEIDMAMFGQPLDL